MDLLIDDCLLYIFDFLKPLDWASASEVCTRWKKLLTNKWKGLAKIRIEYLERHDHPVIETDDFNSLLKHAGPFITKVDLRGDHFCEYVIHIGDYCYAVRDLRRINDLITVLTKFCTHITTLTLSKSVHSLRELFQVNRNVKTLNLLDYGDLNEMFRGIHSMDMVEEINVICKYKHTTCFNWCFPNVQTLRLSIEAYSFWQAQEAINNILLISRKLKRLLLMVIIDTYDNRNYPCRALSNIAECTSIEVVNIIVKTVFEGCTMSFEDDTILKMISLCRNLRVIRLDHVRLGNITGVDALLTLPKLEELYVNTVQKFSCKFLLPLNHLSRLTLIFYRDHLLDFSTLCDAIEKMPELLYLWVAGLSETQTFDLTCKAMTCGIAQGRNVVIEMQPAKDNCRFLKVINNDLNKPISFCETKSQILKLFITTPSEGYCDSIQEFVESSFQHYNISKHNDLCPIWNELEDPHQEDFSFYLFLKREDDSQASDSITPSSYDIDENIDEYVDDEVEIESADEDLNDYEDEEEDEAKDKEMSESGSDL